jgi:uncharacterized DUF497 family protein
MGDAIRYGVRLGTCKQEIDSFRFRVANATIVCTRGNYTVLSIAHFHGTTAHARSEVWLRGRRAVLQLYIQVCYEWDEKKNRLNQRKHGISFEMAALVFEDERCLVRLDCVDETGEPRWHAIGAARIEPDIAVVLLVVHVYREVADGEEITRIISARKAEKSDIRRYQEQEME